MTTTQGEPITTTNEEGPTTTSRGEPISTTRQEEPVTPATEGEPMTSSEGASTGEEDTTANIEGTTSQPTQEPVSEKVTTATNSEPTTDSTSSDTTPTATMDTPTDPALTTPPPPPPVLDVMTNGESFTVMHGASLTLKCHVTGGGTGTTLSWYFNGTKLQAADVGVAQPNTDESGVPRLSSLLTFDLVEPSHAGLYECKAHSPLNSQTVVAPIRVKVTRKCEILLYGGNVN